MRKIKKSKNDVKKNDVKKSTSTTTTKIDIEKINISKMDDDEKIVMRDHLLDKLKNATIRRDKCRIRQQLRKYCQHFGALRNRTYVDKTDNTRHVVERENETSTTNATTK
jgi:hypothetical protein